MTLKSKVRRTISLPLVNESMVRVLSVLAEPSRFDRIPVRNRIVPVEVDGARFVMTNADRCGNARELFWHGGRLKSDADQLALEAVVSMCREASLFLDVGAYTGLFSMACAAANESLDVVAFEIVPENFRLAFDNVAANQFYHRVDLRHCALSDRCGYAEFEQPDAGGLLPSSSSLEPGGQARSASSRSVRVRSRTIDVIVEEIAARRAVRSVVIKLDVEGHEYHVLQGALQTIEKYRADILCEILTRFSFLNELKELVETAGYQVYHVVGGALNPTPIEDIAPDKSHRDWLFTARSIAELRALGLPVTANQTGSQTASGHDAL